jgi:hypothetical protein
VTQVPESRFSAHEQTLSVVVVPSNRVFAQFLQGTHAVAAAASWSQVPPAQSSLGASPPRQKLPAAQTLHSVSAVTVPVWLSAVPGEHVEWLTQGLAGFLSWSHVPSAQGVAGASAPAQ